MGLLPRNKGNRSANRTGSVVSRRLRGAGFNISASARKYKYPGIFVGGCEDLASVYVDLCSDSFNESLALQVAEEVKSWDQVRATEISVHEDGSRSVRFFYGRDV